jgi:capsular exopolysaccharide synthesis family protein
MGKVYDALKRAEDQRTHRVRETTSAGSLPPRVELETRPRATKRPAARGRLSRFWRRVRGDAGAESAGALNRRRIPLLQPESVVAEQFRTLRARIDSLAANQSVRTIAVTSALPGDGKSLAAIGLALVYSMQPGRRVLLIDCDLRRPAVASSLGLRVDAGLAEVLTGSATAEEAIVRVEGSELDALPVRAVPQNPSELLASEAMPKLLKRLAADYDRIILDLPPTLGLPDAKTVSEIADGVVFVVRADVTPEPEIASALEVIDRRRVLGLVMNGAEPMSSRYEGIR